MEEQIIKVERPAKEGEQLSTCPFCGSDAFYEAYEREFGLRWRVCCCKCMAMVDPGYAMTKAVAQKQWNRRV